LISAKAVPSACPIATNSRPLGETQPQDEDPSPAKEPRSAWLLKS
jgi:hypothetical protein